MLNKTVSVFSSLLTKINTDVHLCTSFRKKTKTRYIRERRNVFCLMTDQKKGTKLKCILIDKYLNVSIAQKKVMGVEEKKTRYLSFYIIKMHYC